MNIHAARRLGSILAAAATLALVGCQTVKTTQPGVVGIDRDQTVTLILTRQEIEHISARQYRGMMASAQRRGALNHDPQQVQRVRTVAYRLIAAAPVFRADAGSWQWEINVVTSRQVNAWSMLGGKIVVFSGMLNLDLTDDELAAVLGHEIGHSLREHAREVLPDRQRAEMEADIIGVELAARAGYDPRAALTLWLKLAAATEASSSWLSTHPSNEIRLQDLDQIMVKVMPLYDGARIKSSQ